MKFSILLQHSEFNRGQSPMLDFCSNLCVVYLSCGENIYLPNFVVMPSGFFVCCIVNESQWTAGLFTLNFTAIFMVAQNKTHFWLAEFPSSPPASAQRLRTEAKVTTDCQAHSRLPTHNDLDLRPFYSQTNKYNFHFKEEIWHVGWFLSWRPDWKGWRTFSWTLKLAVAAWHLGWAPNHIVRKRLS